MPVPAHDLSRNLGAANTDGEKLNDRLNGTAETST